MILQKESVVESGKHTLFNWRELWRYRELFYFFTWRDVKIKYKQTTLGFLWAVLQPLIMMLIFTYFFGRVLDIPSQQLPYSVFVLSGLLIWTLFGTGLVNAANSMVNNSLIIKKIFFPRLIIPISSILVALFDFLMAFIIFIFLLVYLQQPVSTSAIWCWPLAIITGVIATVGPGCWLAALNVKYRDFRYVIPFAVQILFFVSPIIYPAEMLAEQSLQYVVAASPIYAPVEFFRQPLSMIDMDWLKVGISLFSGLLFLLIGLLYFRTTEDFFADLA